MEASAREAIRQAFLALPTGNISDAMDALGLSRGSVQGVHPIVPMQKRTAGYALTILQTRRQAPPNGKSLATHGDIIDRETRPGDLIVIDTRGMAHASTGGGLQAFIAQSRGAAGYLTNGCVRDASEIAQLDFPLCCAGVSPVKSGLDFETVGFNLPVCLGGVTIFPGDLVVMDDSGVLTVPQGRIEAVLSQAQAIHTKEERMLQLLRQGIPLSEARTAALPPA